MMGEREDSEGPVKSILSRTEVEEAEDETIGGSGGVRRFRLY